MVAAAAKRWSKGEDRNEITRRRPEAIQQGNQTAPFSDIWWLCLNNQMT